MILKYKYMNIHTWFDHNTYACIYIYTQIDLLLKIYGLNYYTSFACDKKPWVGMAIDPTVFFRARERWNFWMHILGLVAYFHLFFISFLCELMIVDELISSASKKNEGKPWCSINGTIGKRLHTAIEHGHIEIVDLYPWKTGVIFSSSLWKNVLPEGRLRTWWRTTHVHRFCGLVLTRSLFQWTTTAPTKLSHWNPTRVGVHPPKRSVGWTTKYWLVLIVLWAPFKKPPRFHRDDSIHVCLGSWSDRIGC